MPTPVVEGIKRVYRILIVRVAGLTFDRLGWVNESEKAGLWDRDSTPMLGMHGTSKRAVYLLIHFSTRKYMIIITPFVIAIIEIWTILA